MTKKTLLPLIFALIVAPLYRLQAQGADRAPAAADSRTAPAQQLARLADDYWDTLMRLSPLSATFTHYPRYHDRLDDNSASGRAQEAALMSALLRRLDDIDRSRLSDQDKLSWDVVSLQIEMELKGLRHNFWRWNVDHMDGPQSWVASVVETAQPMNTETDAQALLTRMRAMPAYFQNHIANLREGLAAGCAAAHMPVQKTIQQLEETLRIVPEKSPFAAAAERLPKGLREKYAPLVAAAVKDSAYPAYSAYLRFLKDEYLARARPDDKPGLFYLPGGTEAYRHLIRYHTTVDKSPTELHQIGLDELKDIRAQMEAVARRMGHKGDLASFIDRVRHDPKNYFHAREEVLRTAEALIAKAEEKLPAYFGRLPSTPLVVKPVESYREKNDVAAEYYEVPDDLSRPGIYYINTYRPETRARFDMTSLAAHEGVPGHHLQIAISVEQRGLPAFRRHANFTAFIEGWALYAESLADEMGLYADDLSRVGMLSNQALRSCRLVVDTGIHAMGWSRRRAIDFMKANTPMSEEEIATEVDRYIIWPGQALAYKVGQREILALRREAQANLGAKFDIRAFHDAVLENGALPLPILRRVVLGKV